MKRPAFRALLAALVLLALACSPARADQPITALSKVAPAILGAAASGAATQPAYDGAVDKVLRRALPQGSSSLQHYPAFGVKPADAELQAMAEQGTSAFAKDRENAVAELRAEGLEDKEPWLRNAVYAVFSTGADCTTVVFVAGEERGSGRGVQRLSTFSFAPSSGRRLGLDGLFKDPALALRLMSAWCARELEARLGPDFVSDGVEPLPENFVRLVPASDGLAVLFPENQAAVSGREIQIVAIPLGSLAPAGPLPAVWK